VDVGPTCTGDLEVGAHTCTPAHRIYAHGGTGEGIKGVHYVRVYRLYNCAFVRGCGDGESAVWRACLMYMI
jgi:hypothetical protein